MNKDESPSTRRKCTPRRDQSCLLSGRANVKLKVDGVDYHESLMGDPVNAPYTTMPHTGGWARMPARSVCLVTLSLSVAGPGRFGGQSSFADIYHTIPYTEASLFDEMVRYCYTFTDLYHTIPYTL